MKIFFDFLPVILFFGTFKYAEAQAEWAARFATEHLGFMVSGGVVGTEEAPVLLATVVVIVATLAQVALAAGAAQKVDTMLWVSLALVVVLGGATIWFHSATFIKWKPSVLYWVMGLALLDQPDRLPQEPAADADRRAAGAAGTGLAAAELGLGRLLRPDGRAQPVCRLQLLDLDLGELQAVRRHRPDAGVHGRARGSTSPATCKRRRSRGQTRAGQAVAASRQP